MFSFFKKSNPVAVFAETLWGEIRDWPSSAPGQEFRQRFERCLPRDLAEEVGAEESVDRESTLVETIDDVCDEMVYFLSFGADFAFFNSFETAVLSAARDPFRKHLFQFALDHRCKPLPPGDWLGDSWIWNQTGPSPLEIGRPLANLDQRFTLYAAAIQRGKGQKTLGESAAHLLSAWCAMRDASFLLYSAKFLDEYYIGVVEGAISL